jgi:hypothetical protein
VTESKIRIIVVLSEDEKLMKRRWEELQKELGLNMADTLRYMIRETWKRECTRDGY